MQLGGGAGLLVTGAVHLDLYLTGYQTIPTIGWLFLVQVISAFALGFAMIVTTSRLVAAAAAAFLLATLVGYLVSLRVGLFGFREVRTTAGVVAGVVEVVGFAALVSSALRPVRSSTTRGSSGRVFTTLLTRRLTIQVARWAAAVLTVQAGVSLALLLANAGVASTGGSRAIIKVKVIHGVAVLTNARGYTLYWFAPDSSSASRCYGSCAAYWPPVIGTPSAGAGVTGNFTTLSRTNANEQVAYDGHPLYTYVGDSAPGQANGNRIRLNGGWWYEMKESK